MVVVFWYVTNQGAVFIPRRDITYIPFFVAVPLILSPGQVGVTFQNESVRIFFRISNFCVIRNSGGCVAQCNFVSFEDRRHKLGSTLSHAPPRGGIFFRQRSNRRHSSLSVTSIYGLATQHPIILLSWVCSGGKFEIRATTYFCGGMQRSNNRHSSLSVTSIYGLATQCPIIALSWVCSDDEFEERISWD